MRPRPRLVRIAFAAALFLVATDVAAADAVDRHGDPLPPGAVARLGTTRFRAAQEISSVCYSPDGKMLAAASYAGPVLLFDAVSGRVMRRLADPEAARGGADVAFSADGRLLLTTSHHRNAVRIWDAATGRLRHTISGAAARACFSPDGRLVATVDPTNASGLVRLWEAATGAPLGHFTERVKGDASADCPLAFAPDGRTLVGGDGAGTVRVWDVTGRTLRFERQAGRRNVAAVVVAPDGKTFATGDGAGECVFWDLESGKERRRFLAHPLGVFALAYAPDGKVLASAGQQRQPIRLWDAATAAPLRDLPTPGDSAPRGLAFAPDGRTLAAPGGCVVRYDVASGAVLDTDVGHRERVSALAFAPDGRIVATAAADGSVRLWSVDGTPLRECLGHKYAVLALAFKRGGGVLVSAGRDRTVRRWDVRSGRALGSSNLPSPTTDPVVLAPDGSRVAWSSGEPGVVSTWDVASARPGPVRRFGGADRDTVEALAFAADGRTVAVHFNRADELRLWDTNSGRESEVRLWNDLRIGRSIGPSVGRRPVRGLAVAADGRSVVAAADTGITLVGEVASGQLRFQHLQSGREYSLTLAAFSPDGRTLVRADEGGRLSAWDLQTGQYARTTAEPHGCPSALAFAPDGRTVAVGGTDTSVAIWDVRALLPPAPAAAPPRDREALWNGLASPDAAAAFQAMGSLAAAPAEAVALLRTRVIAPDAPDPKHLERLLARLDDSSYEEREKASSELRRLGDVALPALRRLAERPPSAEVRRRVGNLLRLGDGPASPEALRVTRAVEVLERIGTPEARRLIEAWAHGTPAARRTREAQDAAARLHP